MTFGPIGTISGCLCNSRHPTSSAITTSVLRRHWRLVRSRTSMGGRTCCGCGCGRCDGCANNRSRNVDPRNRYPDSRNRYENSRNRYYARDLEVSPCWGNPSESLFCPMSLYYIALIVITMLCELCNSNHIVVAQLLSHVRLFSTLWTAACQTYLFFTASRSLLRFMSIKSLMLSNHLILCHPLLLPSVFPSIRVFSYIW